LSVSDAEAGIDKNLAHRGLSVDLYGGERMATIEIGRYGGTLSLLRNDAGQLIVIGAMTIARLSEETDAWVSLAPNWKVTAEGDGVRVQFKDEDGVVVSLGY
jgi:hypothetical protein